MRACYYIKAIKYYCDSDNVYRHIDTECFIQKIFLSKEKPVTICSKW